MGPDHSMSSIILGVRRTVWSANQGFTRVFASLSTWLFDLGVFAPIIPSSSRRRVAPRDSTSPKKSRRVQLINDLLGGRRYHCKIRSWRLAAPDLDTLATNASALPRFWRRPLAVVWRLHVVASRARAHRDGHRHSQINGKRKKKESFLPKNFAGEIPPKKEENRQKLWRRMKKRENEKE